MKIAKPRIGKPAIGKPRIGKPVIVKPTVPAPRGCRLVSMTGPLVLETRAGRKTQTRRVMTPQPARLNSAQYEWKGEMASIHGDPAAFWNCPYGKPGDVLGIREAAWMWCQKIRNGKTPMGRQKWKYVPVYHPAAPVDPEFIVYCADSPEKPTNQPAIAAFHDLCWRWKAPRFLPRWAVRTFVRIESIRVERAQDISEADAKAEGIAHSTLQGAEAYWHNYLFETAHPRRGEEVTDERHRIRAMINPRDSFRTLWESINAARGHSWESNPWVWVVTYKLQ